MNLHEGFKRVFLLIMMVLLIVSLTAYGDEALPKVTITIGHAEPANPTNYIHGSALKFKEYVEEKTDGGITVKIVPGGALGDADAMLEQVSRGTIEACGSVSAGSVAQLYPDIQVLSIPYVFTDNEEFLAVLRGDFGQAMFEDIKEKVGVRMFILMSQGARHFTNNARPIKTAQDMKGLKIRTMNIKSDMDIVSSLGANPAPIAWTEVYTSLQTGVVDGQENGIPSILLGNLYQVQKYLTLDGHRCGVDLFFLNEKWFQGLPKEYQLIIEAGGMYASDYGNMQSTVASNQGLQFLKKHMEVYEPSIEEIQTFKDATIETVTENVKKLVKDTSWIDRMFLAKDEAHKGLGYEGYNK